MRLGYIAAKIGMGLFAGLAGTAAMTISSTIEMKLRQRPPSMTSCLRRRCQIASAAASCARSLTPSTSSSPHTTTRAP